MLNVHCILDDRGRRWRPPAVASVLCTVRRVRRGCWVWEVWALRELPTPRGPVPQLTVRLGTGSTPLRCQALTQARLLAVRCQPSSKEMPDV